MTENPVIEEGFDKNLRCPRMHKRYNNNSVRIVKERNRVREIIQYNEETKRNILLNHMFLKDDITNKIKDLEAQCLLEVEYIEHVNENLNNRLEELEKKIQQQEDDNYGLEGATPATDSDEGDSNVQFQSWLKELQEKMSNEEKILQRIIEISEGIEKMINSLREVLEYPEEEEINLAEQREAILHLEQFTGKLFTCDTLQNLNAATKYLGSLNGIYAIDEQGGQRRCAKISFSWDNKILLHCLTHEELPPHVSTIQHRDVMSLIHPSSRTVFLNIGTPESTLGRIFINLTPNTKRAENFSILCSGELGPSYLNACITKVLCRGRPGESLLFSKFEKKGRGAVVPGSGEEMGTVFEQPDLAGSLVGIYGDNHFSKFWITTRYNPNELGAIVFGQVESGLHILSEAIAINPINKVQIIDCGRVISI